MPKTYEPIATYTLPSAQSSYTFNSIPNTYTDLILIIQATTISANFNMRFNSDTGSNYSYVSLWGDGSTAASYKSTNNTVMGLTYTSSGAPMSKIQIQNYSSSSVFKSVLIRQDDSTNASGGVVGLWRSTSAITSVTIVSGGNLPTGTILTLYGIKAA